MEKKGKPENSMAGKSPILSKKKGVVLSDKMQKTIIVAVDTFKTHSKYKKKYKLTRHYKVHDEENRYKIGETVEIVPCRPISKGKAYKVVY